MSAVCIIGTNAEPHEIRLGRATNTAGAIPGSEVDPCHSAMLSGAFFNKLNPRAVADF
jgi:hypothetical protein